MARSWARLLAPIARPVDYAPLNAHALMRVIANRDSDWLTEYIFSPERIKEEGLQVELRLVFPQGRTPSRDRVVARCELWNDMTGGKVIGSVQLDMTPADINSTTKVTKGRIVLSHPTALHGLYYVDCRIHDAPVAATTIEVGQPPPSF
jgi:hypothetical protein